MRLEHYPIEKLKKEILEIIGKHLDLNKYKIFFFGSRVTGKGNDRSDIDIVDFKKTSHDFYKVAIQAIEPINGINYDKI